MSYPVSGVGSTSSSTLNPSSTNPISMATFLQLLTTQLANQDPLDPMSNSDFYAQIAQLGQVQGIQQLTQSSSIQQAQSLMGQTVTASRSASDPLAGTQPTVTGVVEQLTIQNGNYMIGIQPPTGSMATVALSSIQSVAPTPNATSLSSLIGQNVTGSATVSNQATQVTGTVTGITTASGVPMLQVKTSQYGTVSMNPSNVQTIGS